MLPSAQLFLFAAFTSIASCGILNLCDIAYDGRVPINSTTNSFDTDSSIFKTDVIKNDNLEWDDLIVFPEAYNKSVFDDEDVHKTVEVTISENSFVGTGLHAALLFCDASDEALDESVTFHWSIRQNSQRKLDFDYTYTNVQYGPVTPSSRASLFALKTSGENWIMVNSTGDTFWTQEINKDDFENFALVVDVFENTIKLYHSIGNMPLTWATDAVTNDNTLSGMFQFGVLRNALNGCQEVDECLGEGQIYGGVFVEKRGEDECMSV